MDETTNAIPGYSHTHGYDSGVKELLNANGRLMESRFDAEAQREIQATIERTAADTQRADAVGFASLGVETAKGFGEVNTQSALIGSTLGTQIQKTTGELGVQVALNTAAVATAVERTGTASALAFKDTALQIAQAQYSTAKDIKSDGDSTRALIIANNDAMLNRLLTTAQNEIIELKGDRNSRSHAKETEVNVMTSVNQNQAQAQAQQQAVVLGNIAASLGTLVSQNQNIHQGIVNLGSMSGNAGTQSAANTRVQ